MHKNESNKQDDQHSTENTGYAFLHFIAYTSKLLHCVMIIIIYTYTRIKHIETLSIS